MDRAKTLIFLLYWVVLITGCILIFEEYYWAASIVRVLLMPVLGAYLFVSLKPTHSQMLKIYFFGAVVFLWVSDLFRIFINDDPRNGIEKDTPLILSLAAFCIANLFYILAYNKVRKLALLKAALPSITFMLGLVLIYFMFFKFISKDYIKSFKTPLICFIESFIFTIAFATNILDSNSRKRLSIKYFLPASFLALISAILFVFNRYKLFTPKFDIVVLLSYGYAQLLNIIGFRKTSK